MSSLYRTIVADPPWHYDAAGSYSYADDGERRRYGMPYETMTLDAIKALPVRGLSDNVDQDAHLYLWTTNAYLRDAFDVAAAWGFRHSATIAWCKAPVSCGIAGLWPTNNIEFVLFCRRPSVTRRPAALRITSALADAAERRSITRRMVDEHMGTKDMAGWWLSRIETRCAVPTDEQWPRLRDFLEAGHDLDDAVREVNAAKGTAPTVRSQRAPSCWFQWKRGAHSQKPEAFLDLVEQVSPGPYLELFSRRQRFGWDTWGDQSFGDVTLDAEAAS